MTTTRILCLVKCIPDPEAAVSDAASGEGLETKNDLVLNPDDACALAWALSYKKNRKSGADLRIDTLTMGPPAVLPLVRDLLRIGVDQATVISDPLLAGSDTLATSRVLAHCIKTAGKNEKLILTGTHSLDGDTAHIPAQVACLLDEDMPAMTGVYRVLSLEEDAVVVETEDEDRVFTWKLSLPAVAGFVRTPGVRLPYVRYADLDRDVDDRLTILSCADLGFSPEDVPASKTRVKRTFVKKLPARERTVVHGAAAGAEAVYRLLKAEGF